MSCFKLPVTLCHDIEALIRKFFWGQRGDSRKVHWVRWEELCKSKEQGGMGFKDLSRFNDALLAKQTWRLLHDKSSLFYRIFKARFFPNCSVMEATCPSSASYAWKSIIKGRDVIKRGAIWRIGDGKSAHIWGDRWLPQKHSALVLSPRIDVLAEAKVQSLIDEERRCWKTELIDETLLEFEATLVKSIPLCLTEQPDELIWPHSANGAYTVKSGYKFLQMEFQNQQPGQSDPLMLKPLWKGIWGLNVPSKVKNLVWRAVKNSLPTKQNLVKRKVVNDDRCDHCKMQQEDTLHALYLCPKLEEIWLSVQAWNQRSLRQIKSIVDLMGCILAENRDPDLFAMVVWAVWKRRNDMRVGKRGENLPNLVQLARNRLQEFLLHNYAATAAIDRPPMQW